MGFSDLFSGLFGGGISGAATPPYTVPTNSSTTITGPGVAVPVGSQSYWNHSTMQHTTMGTSTMSKGISVGPGMPQKSLDVYERVIILTRYADLVNIKLEHIYLPDGMETNDPKVAILKLTAEGEVIKDVGMKAGTESFYVFRSE